MADPTPKHLFYTAFAKHDGTVVPLPQYSHETEHGVLYLIYHAARQQGYTGTAKDRLEELDWWIGPVYATPTGAVLLTIPADVLEAAKHMKQNNYRGPLAWAAKVIDFVADYTAPGDTQ